MNLRQNCLCGVVGNERKNRRVWETFQQAKCSAFLRKGYPFPMLATKLIPTLPTTPRKGKMTVFCKRKTLQSQKRLQRFLNPIQFCRTHLICPLFRLWLFPLLLRSQSVCLYHSYRQGARQAAADWCLSRRGCQKGTGLRIYCNAA